MYAASYFMTLAGMLVIVFDFAFIRNSLPLLSGETVVFPVIAIALFACSLILEAVMLFAYSVITEANALRTMVMRPVFYLGLIGMAAYFIFPPNETWDGDPDEWEEFDEAE